MEEVEIKTARWRTVCLPADGGRIKSLTYAGRDLLTREPADFKAPTEDYGLYETRPVYGYDDCFPSVEPCVYPGRNINIPDHGELCWLPWQVEKDGNNLVCSTKSSLLPVTFTRRLDFNENSLSWHFDINNEGDRELPLLHVMHGLMPLNDISAIELPDCRQVWDESNRDLANVDSGSVGKYLLGLQPPSVRMLFLYQIEAGKIKLHFRKGPELRVEFDKSLFPTLGIWWNNSAYPDEDGCRRTECAFEPIPGPDSNLADCHKKGEFLLVEPGRSLKWSVKWSILED